VSRWARRDDVPRGAAYDERWERLAAAGESIHGEADLISSYGPRSVLDAGCGTGRVAIELANRGVDVVGVDLDEAMLASARHKRPDLEWLHADLRTVEVRGADGRSRQFDVVALPGNVMIFLEPGSEPEVVVNMARHLAAGGRLVAGFEVRATGLGLEEFHAMCRDAGLTAESTWSTWDRQPYAGGGYAVSVFRSGTSEREPLSR